MSRWTVQAEPVVGEDIDEAMAEYFAEMALRVLGRPATEAEQRQVLAADPHTDLSPPDGRFLVARDPEGRLLGYAGVRRLAQVAGTAELKRMYVRPAGRGLGLGRGLLAAAEAAALELGATRMVCETNTALTEARALYAAQGYRETAPYPGHGRADHWFAKSLGGGSAGDSAVKAELDALMLSFLSAFTNTGGSRAKVELVHQVFIPEGMIIKNIGAEPVIYDLDGFVAPREKILSDGTLTEFSEWEVSERTEIFGSVAHRLSRYAKSGFLHGEWFEGTGGKTTQFVKTPAGWRMSAMAWDDE